MRFCRCGIDPCVLREAPESVTTLMVLEHSGNSIYFCPGFYVNAYTIDADGNETRHVVPFAALLTPFQAIGMLHEHAPGNVMLSDRPLPELGFGHFYAVWLATPLVPP
jgi:hypothetical protein